MIKTGEPSRITLMFTEDEFRTIVYAVEAFNHVVQTAPRDPSQASRADAINARRSAARLNERLRDLATGYGIEVP